MQSISKAFGNNKANKDIDFYCNAGEVLCLLGENGAGKSTLMKILYGQYKPDSGKIYINGQLADITSPRVAIGMGIQMVHQHFMLVPTLSVTDNVMIGKETTRYGFYDRLQARHTVEQLSKEYGLAVPADKLVNELSVGEQQRVEIIKALYQGANILILDEPTAVLTPQEVQDLFIIINRLRADGKTVIMITHKLKETMAISDRVYVMRQGQMVASRITKETNIDELSELMVGHKVFKTNKKKFDSENIVLKMTNVNLRNQNKIQVLKDVTLDIYQNEILGIAGVEGNGQMELIEVLSALDDRWEGQISLCGETIQGKKTAQLLKGGMSCIHSDRQVNSVIMSLDMQYNLVIGYQQTSAFTKENVLMDWDKVKIQAENLMDEYDVRPRDIHRNMAEFSGGNQQKFVVGREMMRKPKFLIAAHPTRGVDIMATSFIHQRLTQLKADGAAVLLISSDMDELMELSDRIAVLYDGRIVACRPTESYKLMELGRLMGGGIVGETAEVN